ncbi:rcc01693 family protein [Prosthecomicrobium pneumaticum]|uniref:Putative phage protein (TIGR02216 family) n=1 Tax=Prosthecomicrobium pneumaticum TaxID=81895 RepID=A0A7W9L477_9HYPH|nr:rcc01693 family protein [Prosthecomicrobium pneumaticum]MBB5755289.1 putative phage protein (TIGR02216 family) [Prosthecomicrobium pneumaticum]
MAEPFPWDAAMAFGLGVLRLAPADFWAMTPRELAAAAEGLAGRRPAPMGAAELEALMRRYPDTVRRG